jgi:sugar transferase (PEP-CTERM/EpsH1 system associated)
LTTAAAPAAPPRPIKVMHVMFAFSLGGLEGGVLKLSNGFDRRLIAPSICSCRPADEMKTQLRPDVSLFEMNRKLLGNDPAFVLQFTRLLRRERPDILHTHGWATLVEGFVAARLAGVRAIVHGEHGTLIPRNAWIQRTLWGRVDQVLSVSSVLAQRMSNVMGFPEKRIRTIRNGVETERFTPALRSQARASFGLASDDVVVGVVGRLEPVKDQQRLLDAVGVLARQGMRFKVMIAGEGTLRSRLEEQVAALGIADRVSFLGMRLDVQTVMAALDVFVLSSKSEGLSNTILEAMSSGLPIVATDVGGARELLEPGTQGLLVPSENVEALSRAIGELVTDAPRRVAMGLASRARAVNEFSVQSMIRAYENVYTQTMGF